MSQSTTGICVLRDGMADTWSVLLCRGPGKIRRLAKFDDRSKAMDYAIAYRDRIAEEDGFAPTLHLPDDCPCYSAPG